MPLTVSVYLDLARISCAFIVFASHICWGYLGGGLLWQFETLGTPAVAVFFVLSGYVIGYVTQVQESRLGSYGLARATRIYSVSIPAVVLTMTLDTIGRQIAPDLYAHIQSLPADAGGILIQTLAALTFTNEIWGKQAMIGTNLAYWSLGYEVWYYVAFAVINFVRGFWRWLLLAALLIMVGPNIASRFPLWLLGLALCRFADRLKVGEATSLMVMTFGYAGMIVVGVSFCWHHVFWAMDPDTLPAWVKCARDYGVGISFAATVVGIHSTPRVVGSAMIGLIRPVRAAASCTFSLYLYHLPVAFFLAAVTPWSVTTLNGQAFVVMGNLAVVIGLSRVTEARKEPWRRMLVTLANTITRYGQRALARR